MVNLSIVARVSEQDYYCQLHVTDGDVATADQENLISHVWRW
jgi:hypothetical protein